MAPTRNNRKRQSSNKPVTIIIDEEPTTFNLSQQMIDAIRQDAIRQEIDELSDGEVEA